MLVKYFKIVFFRELGGKRCSSVVFTETFILQSILDSLRQIFGEVGASFDIQVTKLSVKGSSATFILTCPDFCCAKVHTGITLQRTYQSIPCAFHVLQRKSSLLEL